MPDVKTDYLIIGNSAAGITAASSIRECDTRGKILIVGKESYPAYGRPLISYLVEGVTDEDHLGYVDESFYTRHTIDSLLGPEYEAVSLDGIEKRVVLAGGKTVNYGKCLIATGSIPFMPSIEGLDSLCNVFPFMTLDQAQAVQREAISATEAAHNAHRRSSAVIIGAGLIGLKAAEALVRHVDDVTVVSRRWVLPSVLDARAGAMLQNVLAKNGVVCKTGSAVEKILYDGNRACAVVLADGSELTCDLVIAASGVRPNTSFAERAGVQVGNGIVCGPDMQTSLADVYAAGDVAQVTNVLDGTTRPIALWNNAVHQGRVAGMHMVASPVAESFDGSFATNSTYFFDTSLMTSGITHPHEGSGYTERVIAEGETYAKFVIDDNRLVGYIVLNRPVNAGMYTAMIEEGTLLSELSGDPFTQGPSHNIFPEQSRWVRLHEGYPKDLNTLGWKDRA